MKKKVFGRKLSRAKKAREALFRALVKSLIVSGKIVTSKAKAKAIVGEIDKLVVLAKKGTLSARREINAILGNDRNVLNIFFEKVVPAQKRSSGFTRMILLPPRKGDMAEMVRLEWVDELIAKKK